MRPLFAACLLLAATAAAEPRLVTVTGYGNDGADRAAARDAALRDARLRAVEVVAGVEVDGRTVVLNDLLADAALVTRSHGLIVEERVLDEGPAEHGLYRLVLEARVEPGEEADPQRRSALHDRVLACTPAALDDTSPLRTELLEGLRRAGFQRVVLGPACDSRRDCSEAWRAVAGAPAPDLIVHASVTDAVTSSHGGGLHSARRDGELVAWRVRDGQVLAEAGASEARGFGPSGEAAARKAETEAARRLVEQLAARLAPRGSRWVEVELDGAGDLAGCERARALLAEMRWVRAVELVSGKCHPRRTHLRVLYDEEPKLLANALDLSGLAVVERTDGARIEARLRQPED